MKMKAFLTILISGLLLAACGGNSAKRTPENDRTTSVSVQNYSYRIKNTYPHSRTAYTQGLEFYDGVLWEGTGQNGESRLQTIDLESGRETVIRELPESEFGEGITLLGDRIYQLTWTDNKAYVYDCKTGNTLRQFRYAGEGWGLANDGQCLYMSDGSANIFKVNPDTFRREATLTVTLRGEPVPMINELEWIDGRIWANVYLSNVVVIIRPETGVVEGVIDFSGLLREEDLEDDTDVLNGIAYEPQSKRIFVTGKNWPKLFEIELVKQ